MLLAIDVGNTNILFALLNDGEITQRWRIETNAKRTGDEYAVWLNQLLGLSGLELHDVQDVIISSVVPLAMRGLSVLAEKYCKVTPIIAGQSPASFDIKIDLPDPSAVGADRIVNAIAAHDKWAGDLIIIDFGTATTFDVVDYDGAYKGGVIAPGINLSLEALVTAAAKLPRIAIEAPDAQKSVIGTNTEEAMHSGIFWGYISMVEGMVARIGAEIGRPVKIVATGGLAWIATHLFLMR